MPAMLKSMTVLNLVSLLALMRMTVLGPSVESGHVVSKLVLQSYLCAVTARLRQTLAPSLFTVPLVANLTLLCLTPSVMRLLSRLNCPKG